MPNRRNRRKRTGKEIASRRKLSLVAGIGAILVVIVAIFLVRRYMPTNDHMELTDYFVLTEENQVAVILNGEYLEVGEDESIYALVKNDVLYLEIDFLKDELDDGYVYDSTESTLRYATDTEVITATLNSPTYTVDRTAESLDHDIVIMQDGAYYLAVDFVELYTDITATLYDEPYRVVIETAGYTSTRTTLKKDAAVRRHGGVKSEILEDGTKGEEVTVLEDYGDWSFVLTEAGTLGCVKNSHLSKNTEEVVTEARLEERTYNHITSDEDIVLAWHQVTNTAANADIDEVLSSADINVISPTWFYLNDNTGGIASLATSDYVSYCHAAGVQVWGLVSNLENSDVDTTTVLNTTSSRDNLVNNLISQALYYNLDGINVDFEALSNEAKDGYIQFIRELSIKCENNGIILSVDNYVPSGASAFYNRSVQADYADYVIIMAYDEHYAGGGEAGSVSSFTFVENGVVNTLEEVPAEQIILGLPFYTRVWATAEDGSITSTVYGMDELENYISANGMSLTWLDEEAQYYGTYESNGVTYEVWVEDETSLGKKLEVKQEYNLAGAAFWKLGFEKESIWDTIVQYMN